MASCTLEYASVLGRVRNSTYKRDVTRNRGEAQVPREGMSMRARLLVSAAAAVGSLAVGVGAAQAGTLAIHVLSDRADAISGGDALVSVSVPRGISASSVKVALGSSDVTSEFAMRPNGSYEGLLGGLQ